ncbi:MAG: hypothetical protein NDI94_03470 [Candidatus Woesearchaeota archaeon]|nr:hypothetical protein [Candidatus Woesearchaeota archaeon]
MRHGSKHNDGLSSLIHALYLFGVFGAFSVLIDLDHVLVLLEEEIPITAHSLITYAGRPLHLPVLIVIGAVCIYSLASLYRLRSHSR